MPANMPRLPEPGFRSFLVSVLEEEDRLQLRLSMAAFDDDIADLERSLRLTRELRTLVIDLLVNDE